MAIWLVKIIDGGTLRIEDDALDSVKQLFDGPDRWVKVTEEGDLEPKWVNRDNISWIQPVPTERRKQR